MVICPGGGYGHLAEHEGDHYARWLNAHGIAGFVLKYRLATDGYHSPAMLLDALRAVRTVRYRADEWGVDPHRVGIMGSSAGGHLAATALVHGGAGRSDDEDSVERESSLPNLGVLCYPVIAMDGPFCHQGSKANLLGDAPVGDEVEYVSPQRHVVTAQTPPVFLWHTLADQAVPPENSLMFAWALRNAGVAFDLHIYQNGGHGIGLGSRLYDPASWHPWTWDCIHWLREHGFAREQNEC
jgi:acetyl esterase/lipase